MVRLKLVVRGAVQGVGFRPFIFRLATELELAGWVNNSAQGVFMEMEGARAVLETFLLRLGAEKPPRSAIQSLESTWLEAVGHRGFAIRPSAAGGPKSSLVLPDIATCPDCLREIMDPTNRRYRYPFTNCTNCGPRFSIIEALPYDRANTTMKGFDLCPECKAEYDDPRDRRFHAQPTACSACGPHLEWWTPAGEAVFGGHTALRAAVRALQQGGIVAVKGVGGFHLMVDAGNDAAVRRLRARKQREEKPFALLFPTLDAVRAVCEVSPLEARLLGSPEAPIVLLRRRTDGRNEFPIAEAVAPGNPNLGVMLPSNPLHHLLMAEWPLPLVATSGNVSHEPMCIENQEAVDRLGGIADGLLVHDRPIVRQVDDSVVRVVLGREMMLRRARGYAPLPITLNADGLDPAARPVLAVGAHLKNSIALAVRGQVFLSQHIGDLATEPASRAFRRAIGDLVNFHEAAPAMVVSDLHPDYSSTQFAGTLPAARHLGVQHHVAHVLSCLLENEVRPPALGVAWDGTGFGPDGTVWGGEFFLVTETTCERVAHLRQFRLPGGDQAAREPRRAALGVLYELFGDSLLAGREINAGRGLVFSASERATLRTMLQRQLNAPLTSSAGRLFDAVAALTGGRQTRQFEGQAAMELEWAIAGTDTSEAYPFPLVRRGDGLVLDWAPLIEALLAEVKNGAARNLLAAKFHNALADGIVAVAQYFNQPRVALSGGCFQNQYLLERVVRQLQREQFQPCWHQRVPANDGGIALGQIAVALRRPAANFEPTR
jgi:hydrogenase maturation protein HypF